MLFPLHFIFRRKFIMNQIYILNFALQMCSLVLRPYYLADYTGKAIVGDWSIHNSQLILLSYSKFVEKHCILSLLIRPDYYKHVSM